MDTRMIIRTIMLIQTMVMCSGCATYVVRSCPADAPKGVYPATRSDVTGAVHYWQNRMSLFWSDAPSKPNLAEKVLFAIFAIVDLPISVVTDTVMLPGDLRTGCTQTKEIQAIGSFETPAAGASGGQ